MLLATISLKMEVEQLERNADNLVKETAKRMIEGLDNKEKQGSK